MTAQRGLQAESSSAGTGLSMLRPLPPMFEYLRQRDYDFSHALVAYFRFTLECVAYLDVHVVEILDVVLPLLAIIFCPLTQYASTWFRS